MELINQFETMNLFDIEFVNKQFQTLNFFFSKNRVFKFSIFKLSSFNLGLS
jgi:hypothetical protein